MYVRHAVSMAVYVIFHNVHTYGVVPTICPRSLILRNVRQVFPICTGFGQSIIYSM